MAAKHIREYIDAHLQEALTLSAIAKAVGYSQYHAARIFKEETGLSPFEYIRRQRLLGSAFALRNGKPRVLDIALDFVFDSHEGFTRAFSNAFGITPKKYSSYPKPDGWRIPYRYLDRHKSSTEEQCMEAKTAVIFTQIMERPERKLILFRSKKATESPPGRGLGRKLGRIRSLFPLGHVAIRVGTAPLGAELRA